MDKQTLTPLMTVVGIIAATSLFLVLLSVFSGESGTSEQDVSQQDSAPGLSAPPADQPQALQPAESADTAEDVRPEEPPQESEPDIAQLVSELASPLRYVKVVPGAPRLGEDKEPSDSYTVTVAAHPPDIEDLFGMYKYTFEMGNDFSDMAALCQAVTDGPQSATVKLARSQVIFEGLYAISSLIDLRQETSPGDTVEILVKGYADGQTADWGRPLLEGRYAYHAIDVYPPLASGSQELGVFLHNPVTLEIPSTYNNHTLPDLRAQFIKDAILRPFLRACVDEQIPVKILKGYAFASPDNPLQRRVDIYLNFY